MELQLYTQCRNGSLLLKVYDGEKLILSLRDTDHGHCELMFGHTYRLNWEFKSETPAVYRIDGGIDPPTLSVPDFRLLKSFPTGENACGEGFINT